ncbi:GNAT family N-acetyltransferase [Sphingobacterium faecium]|uniref:GNAT family N-acetyltransferase n=1 Tax=Sphingobacterium faecium TaxID=34087 RepID=UPI001291A5D0|nr:GNAT family N-acetyltransferase [Sphingobacterium faecium]MQP26931.1 GNAT family N-acetyltransferase [Sphingobacterium faecium]
MITPFSIQIQLENNQVRLIPVQQEDLETLYAVAQDPKVWEQHPNKNRFERAVFENFFEGALLSRGAYLIQDKNSNETLGSTRFYNYNSDENSIFIGYTFYATKTWGTGINPQVKNMMLDYIFDHVDIVYFHVGNDNERSKKAMEKLGAKKIRLEEIAYHGEPNRINILYSIRKEDYCYK